MGFKASRTAAREIAQGAQMKRHMQNLADDAAKEVDRRASPMVKENGRIEGRVTQTEDGWTAEVAVKSAFYHWQEWGTSGRHFPTAQPFIRPGVQHVLSRAGGRWKTQ